MACMFVGSATARNSRLPRRNTGSTRCLARSLSLTSRTASRSRLSASRSSSGTPNSLEAATAMSRAFATPLDTSWVTTLVLRSRAALRASSIAASSTTPSCTRRWGRPPRPPRAEPSAKEALSFMGLRLGGPGEWEVEVQFTRAAAARNCQILTDSESPGRFGGGVRVTLGSGGQKESPGARPGLEDSKSKFRSRLLELCRNVLLQNAAGGCARIAVRHGRVVGGRSTSPVNVALRSGCESYPSDVWAEYDGVGTRNLRDPGSVIGHRHNSCGGGNREAGDILRGHEAGVPGVGRCGDAGHVI